MKTRRHPWHLTRLEDRLAPANLAITNLELVDAFNAVQANPVYGQMLYLRASWSASGMAGTEQAPVRIAANGMPLDSKAIAFSAGNSTGTTLLNGWYIGTTTINVTAAIDPGNAVAESSEADNTFNRNVAPVAPTTLPMKLVQPLGRAANVDYTVGNYVDIDPRPYDSANSIAYEQDARGGPYEYDGHAGYDSGPYGYAGMDAGFPVYAAADGTVTYASDGQYDREMYTNNSNSGNIIEIDHGNNWKTVYFHLAANTLTVKVGDTIRQGQVIALMGASGFSNGGQHLHYATLYRGAVVETLYAPNSYWFNPLPYSGDVAPFVYDTFVTNVDPYSQQSYDDITYEKVSRVNKFSTSDPGTLFFVGLTWNVLTAAHTTVMSWKWYRPDGSLWNTWGTTWQAGLPSRNDYWSWYWAVSDFAGTPGTWQFAFELDGVEKKRVPFTIGATGDANLRVSFNNPYTFLNNQVVADERTTPIEFGSVAQAATAPTQSFTLANSGTTALSLTGYSLPTGFSFVGSPPASVPAASSTTLVVQMDTAVVGAKFGRIRFATNDPDVPEMNFNLSGTVTGTPLAGAPVIALPDKALSYDFKSTARRFAPNATLTDSDSANFNTGVLTVEIASGSGQNEILSINNEGTGAGQIGLSGANVNYGGTLIGTQSGGISGVPLSVTLNSAATPAAVQALIRNLNFAMTGASPSYQRRYVRIRLTDNTGKLSNLAIANITPSGIERSLAVATITNASTSTGTPFTRNGSFTDLVGTSWTAAVNYNDDTGVQSLTLNPDKTFTLTRTYATPGDRTVQVTITSNTGDVASATFTVSVVVPPTVSGTTVNNHSRLTSITVNFGTPQNAALLAAAGAITLTRTLGGPATVVQTGATGANGRITVAPASGTVSSITLTFNNANGASTTAGVEYGSLADGYWRLAIPSLGYQSSLNDPALRRLFGDFDNNGTVEGTIDFPAFGAAFNTTQANSPFDFDGNGTIDGIIDFPAFGARFNVAL